MALIYLSLAMSEQVLLQRRNISESLPSFSVVVSPVKILLYLLVQVIINI